MSGNLIEIFLNISASIKVVLLSLISFIMGSTVELGVSLLFLQNTTGEASSGIMGSNWLPTFLGGLGGLIVVIIGQISSHFLEQRSERIKEERRLQDEKDSQHITFTDKIAELQQERDERFLEELKRFHESQLEFKDSIIKNLRISEYAAKQREHLSINEVNRLWAHITLCHASMKINNIDIPELKFKGNEDIMEGLEEKIVKFANSLNNKD